LVSVRARLSVAILFDRQRTSATKHSEEVERAVGQRSTARAVDTPRVCPRPAFPAVVERAFQIAAHRIVLDMELGLAQLASTGSLSSALGAP
jgi:hypothetical protein